MTQRRGLESNMRIHTGTPHRNGSGNNLADGVSTGAELGKAIKQGVDRWKSRRKSKKPTHTTKPRGTHGRGGAHAQPKVGHGGARNRVRALRNGGKAK